MGQLRKLILPIMQVSDIDGSFNGPFSGGDVTVTKAGAALKLTSVDIAGNASGTVQVLHPGSIQNGDVLQWYDASTGLRSTSVTLLVTSSPVFTSNTHWEFTVTNLTPTAFTPGSKDYLINSSAGVTGFSDDTGINSIGSTVTLGADGTLRMYVKRVPNVDVYSSTVNNLNILDIPTQGPAPYVTPEDFGAVGDGTTDDSVAIQAAMDYAQVIRQCPLRLGPHTYFCASTLTSRSTGNPLIMRGEWGLSVIKSSNIAAVFVSGNASSVFADFAINATGTPAFGFAAASGDRLLRLNFSGSSALKMLNIVGNDGIVTECSFTNSSSADHISVAGDRNIISNNNFDSTAASNSVGVLGDYNTIIGNVSRSPTTAHWVVSGTGNVLGPNVEIP